MTGVQTCALPISIYPALTPAEEILEANPDGIMLSNGPGDPKECTSIIKEIKKLYDSEVPIFAICLGHQLMALATGGDTHKMKYGHRGGNHPVKDLATGRVYISSQNHGYVDDALGNDELQYRPRLGADGFSYTKLSGSFLHGDPGWRRTPPLFLPSL